MEWRGHRRGVGRAGVLPVLAALVVMACGTKVSRSLVEPDRFVTLDARSPVLKAHRADGGVYVLSAWRADSTAGVISGRGQLLGADRALVEEGEFLIPVDSVTLFETNVEGPSGPATALTVMFGITAAVAGVCIASPKTCFGSCPTFYAPDDTGGMSLQAEGFSSSVAPGLEATDIDMLLRTRPRGRDYTLRVTNEAFETHVIRRASLLLAPRPPVGQVFMTSGGTFLQSTTPIEPTRCEAAEGDCLSAIRAPDGEERFSPADSTDLAAREIVELEFGHVPDGDIGLVIASRQTLMTTFLIYQALAYLGDEAGRWLAALSADTGEARDRIGGIGRELGGIDVLVRSTEGTWIEAGSVGETGPIAIDTRVVPLPGDAERPLQVRLRLTRGLWRLDQIALVGLGDEVETIRLDPVEVRREGRVVPYATAALLDPEQTLVTLPGDAYELSYRLPDEPDQFQIFLAARGYYLEWMREEWMAEQNPIRAAQLVLDPAQALRDLAPVFKREEGRIESLFWNSRYVGS